MIKDILGILNILINKRFNFVFFCENKSIYDKIFYETIKILVKSKKSILVVTLNSNIKKINSSRVSYIDLKNIKFVFFFLKIIKNQTIITSTPVVNKSINNLNKYIYIQHSLIRLVNSFTKKHLEFFDVIFVTNSDQLNDTKLLLSEKKVIVKKIKYHNVDFINYKKIKKTKKKTILIATSFYENHILKLINVLFLKKILKKYEVIFRIHNEILKNTFYLKKIKEIETIFQNSKFKLSKDVSNFNDIEKSDYLITDFSGIALTFSLKKKIPSIVILKTTKDKLVLTDNFSPHSIKKILLKSKLNYNMIIDLIKKIEINKKEYNKSISEYSKKLFRGFDSEHTLLDYLLYGK